MRIRTTMERERGSTIPSAISMISTNYAIENLPVTTADVSTMYFGSWAMRAWE